MYKHRVLHPFPHDALPISPANAGNRLYKNNRDGTFTDVTEKAGLKAVGWASSVCVGDYNNDGFEDLNPDRKSTRLNSSHTVISYAVFCLKKKIETGPTRFT